MKFDMGPLFIFMAIMCYLFGVIFLISSILAKQFPDSAKRFKEDYPRYMKWQVWYTCIGSVLLAATGTAFIFYKTIDPWATIIGFFVSLMFLIGGASLKRQREEAVIRSIDEIN